MLVRKHALNICVVFMMLPQIVSDCNLFFFCSQLRSQSKRQNAIALRLLLEPKPRPQSGKSVALRIPLLHFMTHKPHVYWHPALSKLQDSAQRDAAAVMRGTQLAQDILTQVDVTDRWKLLLL
jgi:hypothetical protein